MAKLVLKQSVKAHGPLVIIIISRDIHGTREALPIPKLTL